MVRNLIFVDNSKEVADVVSFVKKIKQQRGEKQNMAKSKNGNEVKYALKLVISSYVFKIFFCNITSFKSDTSYWVCGPFHLPYNILDLSSFTKLYFHLLLIIIYILKIFYLNVSTFFVSIF